MCDADILAPQLGCILFRAPKYIFLLKTYIFFNF
jgi:hypothetical protein